MAVKDTEFDLEISGKKVSCISTTRKDLERSTCIVLGHGASGDANSGNLPNIAESLAEAGQLVVRYSTAGQLPTRVKILEGGRTACAVARKREDVAAVILFSYPLHPPGKPDQLRDEDLTALQIPVLIVKGTKDTFSTNGPFEEVMSRMTSPRVEIEMVEKGDHSLSSKSGVGKERYDKWIKKVIEFVESLDNPVKLQKTAENKKREHIAEGEKPAKRKRAKSSQKD